MKKSISIDRIHLIDKITQFARTALRTSRRKTFYSVTCVFYADLVIRSGLREDVGEKTIFPRSKSKIEMKTKASCTPDEKQKLNGAEQNVYNVIFYSAKPLVTIQFRPIK